MLKSRGSDVEKHALSVVYVNHFFLAWTSKSCWNCQFYPIHVGSLGWTGPLGVRRGGGRAAGSAFMAGLVLWSQEKGCLGFVLSEETWREEEQGVTE